MHSSILTYIFFVLVLFFGMQQQQVMARPHLNNWVKRGISGQYMQDMQTKVGLNRITGVAITIPVAHGINLAALGRKRRSESRFLENLFNQSEEDQGDPREDRIEANNAYYEQSIYDYK